MLVAAGAWTRRLGHALGVDVAIRPVRGWLALLAPGPPVLRHAIHEAEYEPTPDPAPSFPVSLGRLARARSRATARTRPRARHPPERRRHGARGRVALGRPARGSRRAPTRLRGNALRACDLVPASAGREVAADVDGPAALLRRRPSLHRPARRAATSSAPGTAARASSPAAGRPGSQPSSCLGGRRSPIRRRSTPCGGAHSLDRGRDAREELERARSPGRRGRRARRRPGAAGSRRLHERRRRPVAAIGEIADDRLAACMSSVPEHRRPGCQAPGREGWRSRSGGRPSRRPGHHLGSELGGGLAPAGADRDAPAGVRERGTAARAAPPAPSTSASAGAMSPERPQQTGAVGAVAVEAPSRTRSVFTDPARAGLAEELVAERRSRPACGGS